MFFLLMSAGLNQKIRGFFVQYQCHLYETTQGTAHDPMWVRTLMTTRPKSWVVLWLRCVAHEAAERGRGVPQRSALLCSCGCQDSPRYKIRVSDCALSLAGYDFSSVHVASVRSEFAVLWLFIIFSKGHEEDIIELAVLILGHTRDFTIPGTQL